MTARELRPLGKALGTEALGVDLSKPLDAETFAWIEKAFAEHPVLVFREQELGPAELAAFGRRFGRRRSTRWSITAMPNIPRCHG
jgi:taurine dioxygenase